MNIDRRSLLLAGAASLVTGCSARRQGRNSGPSMAIALLHLAPPAGQIDANRQALERAVEQAASAGAQWILTPELCISGYAFSDVAGTDWIAPQPDAWLEGFQARVAQLGVTVFLGLPERDPETQLLHNTLLAIGPQGQVLGRHRKIRTLKVGSEAWSSPGHEIATVGLLPLGPVGMMICADAVDTSTATSLADQGAQLLVSAANWAPGMYGPSGEWERCSAASGLPLIVCNRTGQGRTLDFREAASVVVCDGERVLTLRSPEPVIWLLDWDLVSGTPRDHQRIPL